ncbi:hypothetical protein MCOR25_011117 [Pyricularia grisea]|nr:hypothetical protein MCOR25_011117 [Pyricularia grisea]
MTNQTLEPDGLDVAAGLEKSGMELLAVEENTKGHKHESMEETENLRKAVDDIPSAAWLVMLLTMAERFSFYGMTAPCMNFMQNSREDTLCPGALGWGQSRASQVSNVFYIMTLLRPIGSGFVADKQLGRYKVLCITFAIYLAGSVLLLLSSIPGLKTYFAGLFITALALVAVGMSEANGLLAAFVGD